MLRINIIYISDKKPFDVPATLEETCNALTDSGNISYYTL